MLNQSKCAVQIRTSTCKLIKHNPLLVPKLQFETGRGTCSKIASKHINDQHCEETGGHVT